MKFSLVGLCDFEEQDFCNWENSNQVDFVWLLNSGPTPSEDTGPSYDHTYQFDSSVSGFG